MIVMFCLLKSISVDFNASPSACTDYRPRGVLTHEHSGDWGVYMPRYRMAQVVFDRGVVPFTLRLNKRVISSHYHHPAPVQNPPRGFAW